MTENALSPSLLDRLNDVADCLQRYMRAVAAVAEVDASLVTQVAKVMPTPESPAPAGYETAMTVSHGIDSVDAMVALVMPRLLAAGPALERAGRSVRRTVALMARLEAGWPRRWTPDGAPRPGDAGEAVVRPRADDGTGGDTRESLLDDLREEPDDSGLFLARPGRTAVRLVVAEAEEAVRVTLPERDDEKPPAPRLETVKRHLMARAAWIDGAREGTGPPG